MAEKWTGRGFEWAGVSDVYLAKSRTPTNLPEFASGLLEFREAGAFTDKIRVRVT